MLWVDSMAISASPMGAGWPPMRTSASSSSISVTVVKVLVTVVPAFGAKLIFSGAIVVKARRAGTAKAAA